MGTPGAASDGAGLEGRVLLASASALSLFVVGLVAPLTPSAGCPGAWALGLFVAAPILLLAWAALRTGAAARIGLLVQAGLTLGAALWLLVRTGCLP